jgi:hypothetical protein
MPPMPETGNIRKWLKAAFRLEELCGEQTVYEALQMVINPSDGVDRVDKGWLLGVSPSFVYLLNIARC